MRILRVINNNVVLADDDVGQEHILMGKGIGFRKKTRDIVNEKDVEKRFSLDKQESFGGVDRLFEQIPTEYMQVTSDFMACIGEQFGISINYGIYVAIAYHIFEACKRVKEGRTIKNELLLDTMNSYPGEFALANQALNMVKEQLGVILPRDEAGFIAIHLVNLRLHGEQRRDLVREFTDKVLAIVEQRSNISLREATPTTYERFLNHLNYLGRRLYEEKNFGEWQEDDFYRQVSHKYREAWECVSYILDFIKSDTGIDLPDDEIMYLTIYIQRIRMEVEE
ncbi:MAG: PRD domain-containing protein [Lachnospiraceae bacterium]|nr:PRD domain-containing protein [Lachnospiraceae bacterium]